MIEIRKEISGMAPYPYPAPDSADVKLDQNESGYDVPVEIREKFAEELPNIKLNRYPDSSYLKLRELIAKNAGCKPENVLIGNGGDEILQMIALAYLTPGVDAITLVPTFSVYRMVCAFVGCRLEEVPLDSEFGVPQGFVEKCRGNAVFLCNPNNPTGTVIAEEIIDAIAKNAKLVILDEAYAEFMEKTYPIRENVISLRTFSKAYCAAGLRVGYAIAPEKLIEGINRVRMPWNLNVLSEMFAEILLENSEWFGQKVKETIAERERMAAALSKFAKVYQSGANFLLVRSEKIIFEKLLALGVKVRKFSYLPGFFRITIGTKEENGIALAAAELIASDFDSILFDMDGVLVDVRESYRGAIKKAAGEFAGSDVTDAQISALKAIPGFNNDWDVSYALAKGIGEPEKVNRESADYAKIKWIFQEAYLGAGGEAKTGGLENRERLPKTSGAATVAGLREQEMPIIGKEMLLLLKKKYRLGIVTSRPREEALWAMERMFAGVFELEFLVAQEDCKKEKPSPEPVRECMRKMDAKKAVYIGDSASDLAAAKAAGIQCIYVGKERNGAKIWMKNAVDLEKVMA
jgi:histidinol-phosphate aminotransferase